MRTARQSEDRAEAEVTLLCFCVPPCFARRVKLPLWKPSRGGGGGRHGARQRMTTTKLRVGAKRLDGRCGQSIDVADCQVHFIIDRSNKGPFQFHCGVLIRYVICISFNGLCKIVQKKAAKGFAAERSNELHQYFGLTLIQSLSIFFSPLPYLSHFGRVIGITIESDVCLYCPVKTEYRFYWKFSNYNSVNKNN